MHYALGRRIRFTVRSLGKKVMTWIVGRFAVLRRLIAPRTSPRPRCGPLGSTPILVTHCGYSVGANGRP
jgi:hypothetical protein